jgi:hypothetical protein
VALEHHDHEHGESERIAAEAIIRLKFEDRLALSQ